jgi:hypothetical protein
VRYINIAIFTASVASMVATNARLLSEDLSSTIKSNILAGLQQAYSLTFLLYIFEPFNQRLQERK